MTTNLRICGSSATLQVYEMELVNRWVDEDENGKCLSAKWFLDSVDSREVTVEAIPHLDISGRKERRWVGPYEPERTIDNADCQYFVEKDNFFGSTNLQAQIFEICNELRFWQQSIPEIRGHSITCTSLDEHTEKLRRVEEQRRQRGDIEKKYETLASNYRTKKPFGLSLDVRVTDSADCVAFNGIIKDGSTILYSGGSSFRMCGALTTEGYSFIENKLQKFYLKISEESAFHSYGCSGSVFDFSNTPKDMRILKIILEKYFERYEIYR